MSEEPYSGATPNFTDTGQWRLIVDVSAKGLAAVLKNVTEPDVSPVVVADRRWNPSEGDVLRQVEAAVYDNPRMLDDFATHIVVTTPHALWIPEELTEDEEFNEKFFTSVFPSEREDISADFGSREVCLYSLVPGLNAFFQRTMPGCKTSSHLSILKKRFDEAMKDSESASRIFVSVREGEADIFAYSGRDFLCATTHSWMAPEDIGYKVLLTARACEQKLDETKVTIISGNDTGQALKEILSGLFGKISISAPPSNRRLPLTPAASLAAGEILEL